jgi:phosphoserine phosphatase
MPRRHHALATAAAFLAVAVTVRDAPAQPLPSWNEGPTRQAIMTFVEETTTPGSPGFVAPAERIAVFDNDGTLWAEQPMYFQGMFAFDRILALSHQHPEWKTKQPYKAILAGDLKALAASGEKGVLEVVNTTHAGMTTEAFAATVRDWLATARHKRFQKPYTELVYAPMVELLVFLRENGFTAYIVSGGGIEFMRVWAERSYGIPPEHVIGSSLAAKFELRDGKPVLVKTAKLGSLDDREGKPVNINLHIGRRPLFAFGNSDGDLAMLQWTAAGDGARFMGIVHHTDATREWAYDRNSHIGRLDKALDDARAKGWTVVDMKRDWKRVFAFEP